MLNSINHLQKIYEENNKTVAKIVYPKLPNGFFYELKRIVTKYEGQDLKHFGVFQNDTLVFDVFTDIQNTEIDSLYIVQICNKTTRICAVLFKGETTILHDGQGNHFRIYPTSILKTLGVLAQIRQGGKK